RNFRRMVIDDTLQVYRPDMFYFGGMIRSIKVARMAHIRGFSCVPHLSGSGLGYLYAMLFVSVIDNAGDYHPNTRDSSNPIPIECDTSSLQVEDGSVKVPTGPGMGVEIDPDFLKKHRALDSRIG
ncbi:MAG: mandelate racemase/muconate lactonizing enzyme family protein, partial [Cyclobacteriaceae bacterium]|nr:mandelate racemase/muconate lactonizing enzyme family protein [Cyclobacteriaceae bacterium HetDA_MAG_MS6]